MVLLLAFITMLIDHIGMIFFPYEDLWRIIGRISFPLFAWWIVRGYKMTKNKQNYAKRILALALISQVPFFFINQELFLNVCFTLLFWLLSLGTIENREIKRYFKISIIVSFLAISEFFHFDYGMYGILTIILLYLAWQKKMTLIYFFVLTFLFYDVNYQNLTLHFHIQIWATLSIFILYFTPIQKYDFNMNYYIKYWFYPVHLMILYMIYWFV